MDTESKTDYRVELELEIETKKAGEGEMLARDQYISMRQLQVQKQMQELDLEHHVTDLKIYQECLEETKALPLSSAKNDVIKTLEKTIKQLETNIKAGGFNRAAQVMLDTFEEVSDRFHFARSGAKVPEEVDDSECDPNDEPFDEDTDPSLRD